MPEQPLPTNLDFSQYSVLVNSLNAYRTEVMSLRQLDRDMLEDHEERIRAMEGRYNIMVSVGLAIWAVSIFVTWLIARGGI